MQDAYRREDHEAKARERAEREEEPIIGGTPLDEMTPFVEKSGNTTGGGAPGYPFTNKPSQAGRPDSAGSGRVIPAIHEPEDEDADDESEMGRGMSRSYRQAGKGQAAQAQRPGFGQGHEMGSVSLSSCRGSSVGSVTSPLRGVSGKHTGSGEFFHSFHSFDQISRNLPNLGHPSSRFSRSRC